MANFELKFIDFIEPNDFIKVIKDNQVLDDSGKTEDCITISGENEENNFIICLDKSTAIKFAKTLRTEINKITESEVNNGK